MAGYFFRGNADNVKVPECNNNRQRTRREDMIGDVKLILGRSSKYASDNYFHLERSSSTLVVIISNYKVFLQIL